ncbi:MAG: hypothetical protein F6K50_22290 [Moorea sp. SIO3I7]|uniref:hypothetical protein n=1 Tax=Moorena sp. SIO3I8 TaxID=2607833 RepID=UPI0013C005DD|nr:hypothetical protein [Moorena sp. SIO3I8]NEN98144.1 hypothetical protein [Moorena sp. SIO3I7]NEO04863.1 hypothetical protein [Moorena sp. SIO3I8]
MSNWRGFPHSRFASRRQEARGERYPEFYGTASRVQEMGEFLPDLLILSCGQRYNFLFRQSLHLPISLSPYLPISPSPYLPISPSPYLPISLSN